MLGYSYVNYVDAAAAVLSASSEVVTLPVVNLASPIIGKRWRASSLTASGQADFGSNKTVGVVCLVFPRDTMGALGGTVRHRFDNAAGTPGTGAVLNSTAISLGVIEGYGYHLYKLSSPVTARYWHWTYNASGVSFIDTGRAWAGEWKEPNINAQRGLSEMWLDLSRVSVSSRSGAAFVDERPRYHAFAFNLDSMNTATRNDVREMQRVIGVSRQQLICFDPSDFGRTTIIGRSEQTLAIQQPYFGVFAQPFRIAESL